MDVSAFSYDYSPITKARKKKCFPFPILEICVLGSSLFCFSFYICENRVKRHEFRARIFQYGKAFGPSNAASIRQCISFFMTPFAKILIKQCLVEAQRAQYGGGIIVNPEFNHSLEGWTMFGQGEIEERISKAGNCFIVVHSRTHPLDSLSQKVQLEKGKLYSFSGNYIFMCKEIKDE